MPSSLSRRLFLQTAGVSSVTMWIPKKVAGYTAADMRAKVVEGRVGVGVSKWELDTPALCVDLDKLQANIGALRT
ncbi:MAG TPA: hypothetical protein VNZ26_01495, partial [Vicinamibacterales bacterium]|nr:hypothetical protein [Vicinamibacterales bacterium]